MYTEEALAMLIANTIKETKKIISDWKQAGKSIGLVPTMGALHEGHLSLIEQAKKNCDFVIASIFVNPTQFGPQEDFDKYPRKVLEDCTKLEEAGCNAVFIPTVEEMFPQGSNTFVSVVGTPADRLEGLLRPGHFQGVATVVLKLTAITTPDKVFFGQKDFQQVLVIRKIVKDLNVPVEIIRCPIIRDADGLAKSSRNAYLSETDRPKALQLHAALMRAVERFEQGTFTPIEIEEEMRSFFDSDDKFSVDYVVIADGATLSPAPSDEVLCSKNWENKELVALIAVRLGSVRLIDNCILNQVHGN